MAKYVVIFNDTLDDIELNGFITMTDKEVENFEELAASITWGFSYPLAEEETSIHFSSGDDLLTRIDFREISTEEFKNLKRIFNGKFGVFITEEFLEGIIGEENDDNDIDDKDDDYDVRYGDDDDED